MLLISPLTDLEITSFLRFRLCVYCFMMTKSIVWWLLNHHFGSSVFCEGQLSLISMCAPVFTVSESRSYFIVVVLSLSTFFLYWQNPFFGGCWSIAFGVLPFAKVSFRWIPFVLLISLLTNLEVTSSFSFCLSLHCFEVAKSFLWWLLTHRFWSLSICNGPFSLVTVYAPHFTVNESRNYFVFEVLTLHVVSWWQNPFFYCYWCFFGVVQ